MKSEDTINITEIFSSVQGETSFTGLPTTFVRLSQCNLRCSWCDTKYSFKKGTAISIPSIIEKVKEYGNRHVCITGGEPLLQPNVHQLMKVLCDLGYILSLETGGSLPTREVDTRVHIILDIKCPGSSMHNKNHWENLGGIRNCDEVKFVIKDEEDYHFAKEVAEKYGLFDKTQVLFSPVFNELHPQKLVEWILRDKLKVRLNLQMHKFIWPPETRGV